MNAVWVELYSDSHPLSREGRIIAGVREYCGAMGLPAPSGKIAVSGRGKPYFEERGPHFSISHSGGLWACAFSSSHVGLDIQETAGRAKEGAIARRFFTLEENRHLKGHPEDF